MDTSTRTSGSVQTTKLGGTTLGTVTIVGALLMAVAAVGIDFRAGEYSPRWSVAMVLVGMIMLLSGPIGLMKAKPYGLRWLGRIGLAITTFGVVSWIVGVTSFLVKPEIEWDQPFTPLGAVLVALGMLVTGVAVVRERRWTGWRRFAPLVVGASYAIVVIPLQVLVFFPTTGDPSFIVLGAWYLTWVGVGLALRAEATA